MSPPPGNRKHLKRLRRIHSGISPVIYLVTVCTHERKRLLSCDDVAASVIQTLEGTAKLKGWLVGRYVVMPDHVHFFCSPAAQKHGLSDFVRDFKSLSTNRYWEMGFTGKLWQTEFFDHLLRTGESYIDKWEYVRHNPVRHGLCESPEEWKYAGEIERLEM